MRFKYKTSKHFVHKIFLVTALVMCGYLSLNPPKAAAQQNPNSIYPGNYYNYINTYEFLCSGSPNKYMHNSWISQDGVPTNNTSISVPYGYGTPTTPINLDMNYHIFLCHDIVSPTCWQYYWNLPCEKGITSRASMAQSLDWVDNAQVIGGAAVIGTSPAGQWSTISNEVYFRWWDDTTPINFSVVSSDPVRGFTTDQSITVRVGHRPANRWGSSWYCVVNGAPTSMAFGVIPANCPISYTDFKIIVKVGPPNPQLSCGNATTSPSSPEPGEDFTVTVNVGYTGSPTPSRPTQTMIASVGSFYTNNDAPYTTNGSAAVFTTPTLNQSAGQYNITWSLSGGRANPVNCTGTIKLSPKPYLRVYGGDVLAGSGFGTSCTQPVAQILAFNKGNGIGAGVQYAAQGIGGITEFASALGRTSQPIPNTGLTFANVGSGVDPTWGGSFGAGICAKDYFSDVSGSNVFDPGATLGGSLTIPGTGGDTYNTIDNERRIILKHDGDVTITGNIMYNDSGGWTDLSQIPSFYLIVRGNIKISRDVTRLDGVFIAQPTSANPTTTGRIYTCTRPTGGQVSADELYNRCINKLTINGAFIANQVKFLRTNGLLRNSTNSETSSSNNIAEVFIYGPELYLVNPGITPTGPVKYDSITSLPPVL
ncbi:MAG TPA: hypothetical protein VJJ78_02145 [Candidatus Saccharimonadales bacterium]|nr:hypothetical protein [Candidatus Saccharimonadales bacterium]